MSTPVTGGECTVLYARFGWLNRFERRGRGGALRTGVAIGGCGSDGELILCAVGQAGDGRLGGGGIRVRARRGSGTGPVGCANWSPLDDVSINHAAAVIRFGPGEVDLLIARRRRHHRRADGAERCARGGVAPGSFTRGLVGGAYLELVLRAAGQVANLNREIVRSDNGGNARPGRGARFAIAQLITGYPCGRGGELGLGPAQVNGLVAGAGHRQEGGQGQLHGAAVARAVGIYAGIAQGVLGNTGAVDGIAQRVGPVVGLVVVVAHRIGNNVNELARVQRGRPLRQGKKAFYGQAWRVGEQVRLIGDRFSAAASCSAVG